MNISNNRSFALSFLLHMQSSIFDNYISNKIKNSLINSFRCYFILKFNLITALFIIIVKYFFVYNTKGLNFKSRFGYRKNLYDRYYFRLIQKKLLRFKQCKHWLISRILVIDVSVSEFLSIHFIEFISFKQCKHWLISRILVIDVSVSEFLSIHFIEFISFKQCKHWLISRIIGD